MTLDDLRCHHRAQTADWGRSGVRIPMPRRNGALIAMAAALVERHDLDQPRREDDGYA
jgi:hypothetical protein